MLLAGAVVAMQTAAVTSALMKQLFGGAGHATPATAGGGSSSRAGSFLRGFEGGVPSLFARCFSPLPPHARTLSLHKARNRTRTVTHALYGVAGRGQGPRAAALPKPNSNSVRRLHPQQPQPASGGQSGAPRQRAVAQAAAVIAPGRGARAAAARAAAAAASPVAAVPAPAAAAPAPAGPSLRGLQRGSVAVVSLPGTYGAGKEYNFADVCRIGEAIEKETITLADLSKKDAAAAGRVCTHLAATGSAAAPAAT